MIKITCLLIVDAFYIQKMSIMLYKVFFGKNTCSDSINPCINTTSFQRRCGLLRHFTTSYHCVSREKDFVWNELSDYVKNELGDKHFSTDFSKKIEHFLLTRKKSTISVFSDWKVIEKSEFKVKYSLWTPYNKRQKYHTTKLTRSSYLCNHRFISHK